MRVIGGEFRSRRLKPVPGMDVRPTPDRLREALFNVLAPRIEGVTFLDAYAGTGAVGIEALSRGAARCIFLEISRGAEAVLRENLRALRLEPRATVVRGKATTYLTHYDAAIVFLDPPYDLDREYETALQILGQRPPGLVIVQHASRRELAETYGGLRRWRVLKQGDNALSFYSSPNA